MLPRNQISDARTCIKQTSTPEYNSKTHFRDGGYNGEEKTRNEFIKAYRENGTKVTRAVFSRERNIFICRLIQDRCAEYFNIISLHVV